MSNFSAVTLISVELFWRFGFKKCHTRLPPFFKDILILNISKLIYGKKTICHCCYLYQAPALSISSKHLDVSKLSGARVKSSTLVFRYHLYYDFFFYRLSDFLHGSELFTFALEKKPVIKTEARPNWNKLCKTYFIGDFDKFYFH